MGRMLQRGFYAYTLTLRYVTYYAAVLIGRIMRLVLLCPSVPSSICFSVRPSFPSKLLTRKRNA